MNEITQPSIKDRTGRVSVVIPAYNQAHYLSEAIDSVLAQGHQDYEIIVVDDGSTDATASVVARYGELIHYIYQENQGLAAARNTGIRAAGGEYVALLDSDDAWYPAYLARMLQLAKQKPGVDVFYCGVSYVDSQSRPLPQAGSAMTVPQEAMYDTLLRTNFLVPSTIMMRRAAVTSVGLFDPDFRRLQDWELWLRLLRQGFQFAGQKERLVRYRLHEDSLSEDSESGGQAAMALARKLFGPDDGRWREWTEDKRRMYGGVYRYRALIATIIRGSGDWDRCARHLRRALQIDPSLSEDLDLFYELALGVQPLGRRGATSLSASELAENAGQVEQLLRSIFRESTPELAGVQQATAGNAYYALGLVSYQAGDFTMSERYMRRALRTNPHLLLKRRAVEDAVRAVIRHRGPEQLHEMKVWSGT